MFKIPNYNLGGWDFFTKNYKGTYKFLYLKSQ